jgi:hypothetical protein
MTNDICLKGFWPPEAKVTVNLGHFVRLTFTGHFSKVISHVK